jgi:hypothetical protein
MRALRTTPLSTLLLLLSMSGNTALAKGNIRRLNAQPFEPSTDPRGVLTVDSAATARHLAWHAGRRSAAGMCFVCRGGGR